MVRKIIQIDEKKCNGCGLCSAACHEGAIGIENGKAKLLRDDYCDGLGNCLPVCPTGAIEFIEREAADYDAQEVEKNMKTNIENRIEHDSQTALTASQTPSLQNKTEGLDTKFHDKTETPKSLPCGCPGSNAKKIVRPGESGESGTSAVETRTSVVAQSQLGQWPVQIKLVPVNAPYFENASLLIAADCTAYAYANFHSDFMRNKITLIGCPKLDEGDYSEKLTLILQTNSIRSIVITRMEVPCCAGIVNAAITALKASGKMIPWRVITFSTEGAILSDE
jgi:Fe-S-cluster-containing hydrogenase component 2